MPNTITKLTECESEFLAVAYQREQWITPAGRWWRTADALVRLGHLEHNGAARHGGEAFHITDAGREVCHEALRYQVHECQCGEKLNAPAGTAPKCDACGSVMWPMWAVMDSRGLIRGTVAGGSESAALESANQTPAYDHLHGFTVRPLCPIRQLTGCKLPQPIPPGSWTTPAEDRDQS
jgi:hypothetical protein